MLKVHEDASLERIKVICLRKDGYGKRIPVIGMNELANEYVRLAGI